MARRTVEVALLLTIIMAILLVVRPSPVRAVLPSVVQQNANACYNCNSVSASFYYNVASGNVLVVALAYYETSTPIVTDTFKSEFYSAGLANYIACNDCGPYPYSPTDLVVYVEIATLSSSGFDTITATLPGSPGLEQNIWIFEVSGVTTSNPRPVWTTGSGTACDVNTMGLASCNSLPGCCTSPYNEASTNVGPGATGPVYFEAGAFLLGIIGTPCGGAAAVGGGVGTITLGTGFTEGNNGNGIRMSDCVSSTVQYSTAGADNPTIFPATFLFDKTNVHEIPWVEVGIVLEPSSPLVIQSYQSSSTTGPCHFCTPLATQTVNTDWAVLSVSTQPSAPSEGTAVKLGMMMTALSTNGTYPQNVAVQCTLDGNSCGSGEIAYPGPTGVSFTVSADNPWIAVVGTHTLTWQIDTTNDPNPANNAMSMSFTVQPSNSQTISTTLTQPSTTQSSNPPVTVVQTQTVTQQPSSTISQATSQPGILDILQQNSLLLIGALGLLAILLAVATMRRGKRGSPTTPTPDH